MDALKKAIMMRRMKNNPGEEESEVSEVMTDAKEDRAAQGLAPDIDPEIQSELNDDGSAEGSDVDDVEMEIPDGGSNVPAGDAIDPMILAMFSNDDIGKPGIKGKVADKIKAAMNLKKK